MKRFSFVLLVVLFMFSGTLIFSAGKQEGGKDWPTKPIRLILGSGAGGNDRYEYSAPGLDT